MRKVAFLVILFSAALGGQEGSWETKNWSFLPSEDRDAIRWTLFVKEGPIRNNYPNILFEHYSYDGIGITIDKRLRVQECIRYTAVVQRVNGKLQKNREHWLRWDCSTYQEETTSQPEILKEVARLCPVGEIAKNHPSFWKEIEPYLRLLLPDLK